MRSPIISYIRTSAVNSLFTYYNYTINTTRKFFRNQRLNGGETLRELSDAEKKPIALLNLFPHSETGLTQIPYKSE